MTNRLLHDHWGDNSKPYTPAELDAARKRFRRQDAIVWVFILSASAVIANAVLSHYWPAVL
jgi:hypothetical protein